jgi:hypothetical protein
VPKTREYQKLRRDGWRRAESIRRYLDELDRRIAAGGTLTEGYAEWRAWAEQCAIDFDYFNSRVELDEGQRGA